MTNRIESMVYRRSLPLEVIGDFVRKYDEMIAPAIRDGNIPAVEIVVEEAVERLSFIAERGGGVHFPNGSYEPYRQVIGTLHGLSIRGDVDEARNALSGIDIKINVLREIINRK